MRCRGVQPAANRLAERRRRHVGGQWQAIPQRCSRLRTSVRGPAQAAASENLEELEPPRRRGQDAGRHASSGVSGEFSAHGMAARQEVFQDPQLQRPR